MKPYDIDDARCPMCSEQRTPLRHHGHIIGWRCNCGNLEETK
jgi:hypothetical protein